MEKCQYNNEQSGEVIKFLKGLQEIPKSSSRMSLSPEELGKEESDVSNDIVLCASPFGSRLLTVPPGKHRGYGPIVASNKEFNLQKEKFGGNDPSYASVLTQIMWLQLESFAEIIGRKAEIQIDGKRDLQYFALLILSNWEEVQVNFGKIGEALLVKAAEMSSKMTVDRLIFCSESKVTIRKVVREKCAAMAGGKLSFVNFEFQ